MEKENLKKHIAQERCVCYIEKHKYNQLSAKLKLQGKSVSLWFREQVSLELSKKDK